LRALDYLSQIAGLTSLYMDTISRENNSMLPVGGVIIGVAALIVGIYAAVSITKLKGVVAAQAPQVARIDDIATQVASASAASDKAARDITTLQNSMQAAVNQLGTELATLDEKIKHIEETHAAHVGKGGPKGEPAVAGPGEYLVKAGDSGVKIARANGCSLADLESVNAGVSWTHLKIGEKLKLPEKK
jgi:LysM repeat protein